MSALRSWLRNRPIAGKLGAVVAIAVLTVVVFGLVGVSALDGEQASALQLERVNTMTRHALEADMAHDAVRGDVLRSLLAANGGGSPGDATQARADLNEHGAILRAAMDYFRTGQTPPGVLAAAERVAPIVINYVDLAGVTIDAASAGERTPASFADFQQAFIDVEEGLPAIGDALARIAADAARTVNTYHDRAIVQFLATGVFGLLLLGAVCWMVARGILVPMRRISGVLAAMADGDLSVRADIDSTDEVGRMAGALNGAIGSVRGTVASLSVSAGLVAGSADEFRGLSQRIAAAANEASTRAGIATEGASEVSANIATLAAGSEEMGASIAEISRNANEALRVAIDAVAMAAQTNGMMGRLSDSSVQIGNVVKVITSIAGQTNLLALNATIEAARAGDAGRGFAVVAGEVKDLAQETARATEEIARRVDAIQADANLAVDAIGQIGQIIARINDFQVTIASAVEEQTASSAETSRTVNDVAQRGDQIAVTIAGLADVAARTTDEAGVSLKAADQLAAMAVEMTGLVSRFRH